MTVDEIAVVGVPWNLHELSPAVQDAEALGVRLRLVDLPEALAKVPGEVRCERLPVPAMDARVIARVLDGRTPSAVVSITEFRLELAALVREKLGLPGTSGQAERAVSDKLLTRRRLTDAGLTQVRCWPTPIAGLRGLVDTLDFPLVVKPRAFAGSNGVRALSGPEDIPDALAAFEAGTAAASGRDRLLVESYLHGEEISAEGLVVDGELDLWSLTDKVNTGPPYFQEIGHLMPSRHTAARRAEVEAYLRRVVAALGIGTAPIHAELKLADDRVDLVEIHTRFGGGHIVQLLTESLGCRPFRAYFNALLGGGPTPVGRADAVWGTGHFTARTDHPFSWSSFDFPYPGAVREIDLRADREPKVREVEGLRIRYWRAGHALFRSTDYREVRANVRFMESRFPH